MVDAKVVEKPFIEIPEQVYDSLGLDVGQSIRITITPAKKMTHQFSKEERQKILEQTQGIWADDEKIAEVFAYLEELCQQQQ
jgi:hypothetical protein